MSLHPLHLSTTGEYAGSYSWSPLPMMVAPLVLLNFSPFLSAESVTMPDPGGLYFPTCDRWETWVLQWVPVHPANDSVLP